jgi:hypothetical protein
VAVRLSRPPQPISSVPSMVSSTLTSLANYRSRNTRASKDVFEKGVQILEANKKITDEDGEVHDQ